MYWSNWFKRWFISASLCIICFTVSGIVLIYTLSHQKQEVQPSYAVNLARVEVSELMFLLEEHHEDLNQTTADSRPAFLDKLLALSRQQQLSLQYAGLDGTVLFDTSDPLPAGKARLNLKADLHYDLYRAGTGQDSFRLAFPVIDPDSGIQAGNALFTLSEAAVRYPQASSFPVIAPALMTASVLLLLFLLFQLRRKVNLDLLNPITGLKGLAEAILRGNYEQKAEYGQQDEIGEVYAVFDQMRSEIMELSRQREARDKAQKELITNISHDLKTPLTAVKAYIDAIQDGVCPDLPAVMEYMTIIQSQTNKMAGLVEDLLVHALRDLGQISVNLTECYSRETFVNILKPMGPYIRAAGKVFIEPAEIPNVLIRVDPVRIEQLLSNLIANALKHTAAGDTIRVDIIREHDQLKLTVSDTGEGILEQDMPFIFERYFQGQAPSQYAKRFKEGTGLGLSICKHIAEAHHGSISFKSIKHHGTEFYLILPVG
ncbi:HAMP domain-containing sensor histidine kinase [Paenibacillus sp. MMS20-IR301]|uniref:sensor histidine kinase n=1 Tax=Paenibacillus sp. MMS20-IR301 TaxID=2895946 RepID=UPI0028EC44B3|nr:HAMP domain-containing sensor histidine kinase [Paenibacillus sp. MMS20-IR301]WNS46326.1 HAMP domain-containing sensor histidine kinase [Paenibacillus sp. MMS20-IR301]